MWLCLCVYVGVPPPPLFQCFVFLLEAGFFFYFFFLFLCVCVCVCVLLILLECSSYHHLAEFITLLPSLLPRPMRLRNKRAIVWGAAPWIRCAGTEIQRAHSIFPIIKRKGEKLILPPSPREWEERRLQKSRLRPPAIKPSYSKAKGLRKKKGNRFTRVFCSCVCTRPEHLINIVGKTTQTSYLE